ncbi:MAG: serine hydrolase domain-containing protein [Rikenellaceae bacterium]
MQTNESKSPETKDAFSQRLKVLSSALSIKAKRLLIEILLWFKEAIILLLILLKFITIQLYRLTQRLLIKLFQLIVIRREKRAIAAAVITILICVISTFKCTNSEWTIESDLKATRDWYKEQSINFLLDNQMSGLEQTKKFDSTIEAFMKRWELTGGSFALMRNDSLIYAKGYGYADKESGVLCNVQNVFRIASASKLITATAAMKLIEEGKMKLTSKVFGEEGILRDTTFLKFSNKSFKEITVEHLLRHTSGLSSPISDPSFANYSVARHLGKELPLSLDDMVLYATTIRVKYKPGTRYEYSNLGYQILTKVIEVVADEDYEKFVQRELLEPAKCYDMYVGKNFREDRDPNEVNYYEVKEAKPVDAYDGSGRKVMKSNGGNNVTLLSGAGGWVASPVELLRFVASINGNSGKADVISKESVNKMTYDSTDRTKKPMGWATVKGREWQRSGSMAGTNTFIKQQKDGYTWVFITNSSAWIGYQLSSKISSTITTAIGRVKEWPKRDLFEAESRKEYSTSTTIAEAE